MSRVIREPLIKSSGVSGLQRLLRQLLLAASMIWSMTSIAASNAEPIEVTADHAEFDQTSGTSIYRGNVVVIQGILTLTADELIVRAPEEGPQHLSASGAPATFVRAATETDDEIKGEAEKIDYDLDQRQLGLKQKAVLWRGGDEFHSDLIDYDIDQRRVSAGALDSDRARVRMVIQPRGAKPDE